MDKELQHKAKNLIERENAIMNATYNEAKIHKSKIKEIRKFLQDAEDSAGEYGDYCTFATQDLWGAPSEEDLLELVRALAKAYAIKKDQTNFEKDKRAFGYCSSCLRDIAEGWDVGKLCCMIPCLNSKSL